jgi:hypothetical protein
MNRFRNINIKILAIVIILIIGIFFAYYKLVLQPQRKQISELTETNNLYLMELENVKQDEALIKEIKSSIDTLEVNIEESVKEYFPSLTQEKIILILDSFINDNNLKCSNISFSSANVEVLQQLSDEQEAQEFLLRDLAEQYSNLQKGLNEETESTEDTSGDEDENNTSVEESDTEQSGSKNAESTGEVNTFSVENMNVSLELEGDYEDITKFINDINKYSKKILIKDITIVSTETEANSSSGDGGVSILNGSETNAEYSDGTTNSDDLINEDGTTNINDTINQDGTTSEESTTTYTIQTITASINLNFYAIPKLKDDTTDYDYINWTINSLYGKENPFK